MSTLDESSEDTTIARGLAERLDPSAAPRLVSSARDRSRPIVLPPEGRPAHARSAAIRLGQGR